VGETPEGGGNVDEVHAIVPGGPYLDSGAGVFPDVSTYKAMTDGRGLLAHQISILERECTSLPLTLVILNRASD
jgi:hypothetical protein